MIGAADPTDNLKGIDCLIVGAGPAGCATALAARRAGVARVAVLDASLAPQPPVAATTPLELPTLLRELGLDDVAKRVPRRALFGQRREWSSEGIGEPLCEPQGWIYDRGRLDRELRSRLAENGVLLSLGSQLVALRRIGEKWELRVRDGEGKTRALTAHFVVDASGRSATVSRLLRIQRHAVDRLVAVSAMYPLRASFPLGGFVYLDMTSWGIWHAVALPGSSALVTYYSDADLARRAQINRPDLHATQLEQSAALGHLFDLSAAKSRKGTNLPFVPAHTQCNEQVAGPGWIAVGDAALAVDPLRSSGLYAALSHAHFAAQIVAATGSARDDLLQNYTDAVRDASEHFIRYRPAIEHIESAWVEQPFWARRRRLAHATRTHVDDNIAAPCEV